MPEDIEGTATELPAAPDAELNGVLVRAVESESGLDVAVQVVGNTRITEAPTLLGLGLNAIQKKLGLDA